MSAVGPSVIGGGHGFTGLVILLVHFLVNDRVPGLLALLTGNVVFPRPAPQPQFFDKVHLRHNATYHDTVPLTALRYNLPNGWRLEVYRLWPQLQGSF